MKGPRGRCVLWLAPAIVCWLAACGAGQPSESNAAGELDPAGPAADPDAVIAALAALDAGPDEPGGPCAEVRVPEEGIWNAEVRGKLDFSVKIYAREITAAEAEWLVTRMDRFALAWIRAHTAACRDYRNRGRYTAQEYRELSDCFTAALDQQRKLLASISDTGSAPAEQMDGLFAKLTDCVSRGSAFQAEIRENPFAAAGGPDSE